MRLKKVGVAASPEGGKPILTGVFFDNENMKQTSFQPTATGLQPTPFLTFPFPTQELFRIGTLSVNDKNI